MIAKRVLIGGRVQGVGYRAWMVREAQSLGVWGWVLNRADGTVEAVVHGGTDAVEELLRRCRRGPMLAGVRTIDESAVEPPEEEGFRQVG